jgi:dnd system-associated protein 4
MATNERRVRRPRDKEVLVQTLLTEGGFPRIRDVLLFSAALGFHRERREPFAETNEPIRWDTLTDPAHAKTLVSCIAAASNPDDPEILGSGREEERIKIFEEYANGGLEVLQGEVNKRNEPIDQVCLFLVTDVITSASVDSRLAVDELVKELSWD